MSVKYPHTLRRFFPLSKYTCDLCSKKFQWSGWTFEGGQFISFNGGAKTGHWFYMCKTCCPNKKIANVCANVYNKLVWDEARKRLEGEK